MKNRGAEWSRYGADVRAMIEEAEALQAMLAERKADFRTWSDADFCAGTKVHGSTWGRIKAGKYPNGAKGIGRLVLTILTQARANQLRTRAGGGVRANGDSPFTPTAAYAALCKAVARCKRRAEAGGEDRLVILCGATGMGKTVSARRLVSDGLATWHIHALPSWRRSYFGFLATLCRSLGIGAALRTSVMESELLTALQSRSAEAVLVVEEVEELGPAAISWLRALLNLSPVSLVLCMTPDFYRAMWAKHRGESKQLLRRSAALIMLGEPERGVIAALDGVWAGAPEQALEEVAQEAARFGGYAFARLVAEGCKPGATMQDVRAAIARARRLMPSDSGAKR